ncbi:hypothetical protein HID58_052220 [Brassica napus]|uniref:MPN domain-containing protein n=1 Tax=Brassica napus TaxID=3708 RepID=A0ABQ8ACD4_BRANA|nr:hypothetical protein HID58_052220 [Brassica napus]
MAATNEHTVLQFVTPSSTASTTTQVLTARIHPLVIFNVCDCFVRRPDSAERVIGTLLGSILPDGTVDIRNSYAVPHNESSDQVAVDIDYHHNMLASHLKVNPKEVIVGWYSTGAGVNGDDVLKATAVDKLPNDMEGMEQTMERLLTLINDVYKYVDSVVEGKTSPDNNIGRFIAEAVASLPKLPPQVFDNLVNDSLQDQLLLLYLSSITRTQLSLAEKLNTAAQML